ncbi:MAG: DNA adenine methylase [Candidatus Gastranaerophilales bacterium]|nr:DNA adenine methylase [Candidatus Gastranaerophilales bacterium]
MTIDTKSLLNWVGGKRLLRKTIEPLIPKDIQSYIEPFGGAGWVLFYKQKWADLEIYNDLDGRLVNLFRIVKYHPEALKEELKYLLGSREMFMQFMKMDGITDIQRAAKFMFLITRSFGGRGETYGTVKKSSGGASKSQGNILLKIDAIHKRLDKVLVENRDFEKLILQYDFEGAFFYCDPPYTFGCGYETTSTKDFDHERLKEILKNIKGRFLLSYDDSEKVRELHKDYEMIAIERLNGINNKDRKNKMFKELLIANYPIKELFHARTDRNKD